MTDFLERVRKNAESVAGIGYWLWNFETDDVHWSTECYTIYGRDPETWTPSPENYIQDVFDEDRERVAEESRIKFKNGDAFYIECRYYKGSDRSDVRWVRTDCDFTESDAGERSIVGVARDITEQKKTEQALQESKDRFQAFADAASDWFWEMDENLRFSYMSLRAEEIVGVPVSYFIGKTRQEVAGEILETEKWDAHLQDLDARRPFRDFRFVRKGHDGRLHYVTTSGIPRFDGGGKFLGYTGASANLTDHMEAEEKVNLAREQLAGAVNAMNEMFVLWDPQDRLVVCNDQFRKINEDVIETTEPGTLFVDHISAAIDNDLFPMIRGDKAAWLRQRLEAHKNPGQPFEVARQDKRWLLIKEQKLTDGSTITVSSDITERKLNEEALRAAKLKAEFASRAKSEFLAHMSHELRTPLNAIIGFSQICESEIFGKQPIRKYVEYATHIGTASTHLLSLISDVLDISKLEEGEFQLSESIFSVETALGSCMAMINGRAEIKNIQTDIIIEPGVDGLNADERLFKQMVLNLLSNAVKFTPAGGHVSVKARVDETHQLSIIVRDSGDGIKADDIRNILEPYTQVRANPEVAHEGTGLGLSIVKGLAELHGGLLSIESEIGTGTQATVQFPAERVVRSDENGD